MLWKWWSKELSNSFSKKHQWILAKMSKTTIYKTGNSPKTYSKVEKSLFQKNYWQLQEKWDFLTLWPGTALASISLPSSISMVAVQGWDKLRISSFACGRGWLDFWYSVHRNLLILGIIRNSSDLSGKWKGKANIIDNLRLWSSFGQAIV